MGGIISTTNEQESWLEAICVSQHTEIAVFGHRGNSVDFPENSMAAFESCWRMGVPIELDVHRCASGELIVSHDDNLQRTSGKKVSISETPWDSLKDYTLIWPQSARKQDISEQHLVRLTDVVERTPLELPILIEVKCNDSGSIARNLGLQVAKLCQKYNRHRLVVISFNPFVLNGLRAVSKQAAIGYLLGDYEESEFSRFKKRLLRSGVLSFFAAPDIYLPQISILEEPCSAGWFAGQKPRICWTVDTQKQLALAKAKNMNGVISNNPGRILEWLRGASELSLSEPKGTKP